MGLGAAADGCASAANGAAATAANRKQNLLVTWTSLGMRSVLSAYVVDAGKVPRNIDRVAMLWGVQNRSRAVVRVQWPHGDDAAAGIPGAVGGFVRSPALPAGGKTAAQRPPADCRRSRF